MLKRIALTAVFVAKAAFGVGVAKAQSAATKRPSAPSADSPQGWPCWPGACSTIVEPVKPQGWRCAPGAIC